MYDEGEYHNGGTSRGGEHFSKSAATAVFTLGSATTAEGLWLELRKSPGKTVFPAGTKLTLLGLIGFIVISRQGQRQNRADRFYRNVEQQSSGRQYHERTQLTVIMDFSAVESLANGDYSLRLRIQHRGGFQWG